jgi:hypothetical protein
VAQPPPYRMYCRDTGNTGPMSQYRGVQPGYMKGKLRQLPISVGFRIEPGHANLSLVLLSVYVQPTYGLPELPFCETHFSKACKLSNCLFAIPAFRYNEFE